MDANSTSNPPPGAAELQAVDTSRCPLCGRDNRCAAAACLDDASSCWCFSASIPKQLLERIPPELRGKSCVCSRCVEAYREEQRA